MADELEQRIRERAYEIWENEGCPEGRGDEHWLQACAEYSDARAEAGTEQAGNVSGEAGSISETASPEMGGAALRSPIPLGGNGAVEGGTGGSTAG